MMKNLMLYIQKLFKDKCQKNNELPHMINLNQEKLILKMENDFY
jgi:hypothetical protein